VSLAQAILYRGAGFAVVWRQFVIVALIGELPPSSPPLFDQQRLIFECRVPESLNPSPT
jgi:hypothetical protein